MITAGVSWLIYPFFGKDIVRKNFLRNGWIQISDSGDELDNNTEITSKAGDYIVLAIIVILALGIAGQLLS